MMLGFNSPYIFRNDGVTMLGQTTLRHNPGTGKVEINNYEPRFSVSDDPAYTDVKYPSESNNINVRPIYELTKSDIAELKAEYEVNGRTVEIRDNKVFVMNNGEAEKVIWWYQ